MPDPLQRLEKELPKGQARGPQDSRPCPVCGAAMVIERYKEVELNTCPQHGVWLDAGELPRLLDVAQQRAGRVDRTARVEEILAAKRDGQMSGMLLGVWAFLFD